MTSFVTYLGNGEPRIDYAAKAKAMPQLLAEAEAKFIRELAECGDITEAEAQTVFKFYKKNKMVKRDSFPSYHVKHGAFLNPEIINRALELAEASAK